MAWPNVNGLWAFRICTVRIAGTAEQGGRQVGNRVLQIVGGVVLSERLGAWLASGRQWDV